MKKLKAPTIRIKHFNVNRWLLKDVNNLNSELKESIHELKYFAPIQGAGNGGKYYTENRSHYGRF